MDDDEFRELPLRPDQRPLTVNRKLITEITQDEEHAGCVVLRLGHRYLGEWEVDQRGLLQKHEARRLAYEILKLTEQ